MIHRALGGTGESVITNILIFFYPSTLKSRYKGRAVNVWRAQPIPCVYVLIS